MICKEYRSRDNVSWEASWLQTLTWMDAVSKGRHWLNLHPAPIARSYWPRFTSMDVFGERVRTTVGDKSRYIGLQS